MRSTIQITTLVVLCLLIQCVHSLHQGYSRRTVFTYKTVVTYTLVTKCCDGWQTNPNDKNSCTQHTKKPIVKSCITPQTVHRRNAKESVFWTGPVFKSPFNNDIRIKTQYPKNHGVLRWGRNNIQYEAVSDFTTASAHCSIVVNVEPGTFEPIITNRTVGENVTVAEDDAITFKCTTRYSKATDKDLLWFYNDTRVTKDVAYLTVNSDAHGYHHSITTITLRPTRNDNRAAIECRLDKSKLSFEVFLRVTHEVPPVVRFCPNNKQDDSSNYKKLVTWRKATFRDPRYNDQISVSCNYGDNVTRMEFTWGVHEVIYTGKNVRNGLSSTCKFKITIKPVECDQTSLMPTGGAVVCGYWGSQFIQSCVPVCADQKGFMWGGPYSKISTCTATGQWTPKQNPISCKDAIQQNTCLQQARCYAGSCAIPGVTAAFKTDFVQKMIQTQYNSVCGGVDDGINLKLVLYCP